MISDAIQQLLAQLFIQLEEESAFELFILLNRDAKHISEQALLQSLESAIPENTPADHIKEINLLLRSIVASNQDPQMEGGLVLFESLIKALHDRAELSEN